MTVSNQTLHNQVTALFHFPEFAVRCWHSAAVMIYTTILFVTSGSREFFSFPNESQAHMCVPMIYFSFMLAYFNFQTACRGFGGHWRRFSVLLLIVLASRRGVHIARIHILFPLYFRNLTARPQMIIYY